MFGSAPRLDFSPVDGEGDAVEGTGIAGDQRAGACCAPRRGAEPQGCDRAADPAAPENRRSGAHQAEKQGSAPFLPTPNKRR